MPRSIPEIITHIRTCVAEPSIHTMLVQTGDLSALCDAADTTLLSQVRQLEAEVGRLKGELSQQIEKTSRALNQVDIEAERAGNFENDKDALEAQVRQKDEALRVALDYLNGCLGNPLWKGENPYPIIEAALSPTPQPDAAPADTTAWLIEFSEKVSRTPAYYGHTGEGLGETTDSLKAVRFARREDAQAIINDIGWNEARPVEHMWADSKCCNGLSPEECAQVPDRHCDGLQPASPLPADVAGMREKLLAIIVEWDSEGSGANTLADMILSAFPIPASPTDAAVKALVEALRAEEIVSWHGYTLEAAKQLGVADEYRAHGSQWLAKYVAKQRRATLAANGVK